VFRRDEGEMVRLFHEESAGLAYLRQESHENIGNGDTGVEGDERYPF
jgi:hypothetical protein